MILSLKDLILDTDFKNGCISSVKIKGIERLATHTPLFCACLRDTEGAQALFTSYDAKQVTETSDGAIYSGFSLASLSIKVRLTDENGEAAFRISVTPGNSSYFVEWVDFPGITLPPLEENNTSGNGGKILYPYNEGALVSDINLRKLSDLRHEDATYPSRGAYSVFPNMICSQMLAYIWNDAGLYVGAHDDKRGVKEIDFLEESGAVKLRFRLFCGTEFGKCFNTDYPIVFSVTEGKWEAAAERYRSWFETSLPPRVKKIKDNPSLPDWYADYPLVVTYPVRGVHDMDEMKPNKLYPYTNALPVLKEIKGICDSKLLVLLMHWEGTAPWAPPYVWPPYGDKENFSEFLNTLHSNGDLLGVYCSGFGYTIQSNLIADYNKQKEYIERGLEKGMCVAPDGKVWISNICTAQRSGYDICPATDIGKEILMEAYTPLLESDIDYAQILDQNHGGGQYFCYGRDHGHAPGPGEWMTENMQKLLGSWNNIAQNTLLGCESAAAEPFIGNLLFSDNRFELNYKFGIAVPLYAYIYHEYLRNFMGNQVSSPFSTSIDSLRYRLAYSFSIGDCMTLILTQDGDLASHWGLRDFSILPDKEKALRLIANLTAFYKEKAKPYLFDGKMTVPPTVECETVTFPISAPERDLELPNVIFSAWETSDGSKALVLVNPLEKDALCTVNGKKITVPALDAILIEL